jgi:methionyl-tRNA formyltransferase
VETCDLIAAGKAPRVKQDDSLASYAPKLEREDARITWERPAREVHNHIRGVNPRPGAFTIFRDGEVKILDSRLAPDTADAGGPDQRGGAGPGPEATAGGILAIEPENGMLVACSPGAVWLRMLQAAGRKSTDGAAFSRGARLARGDYFG